MAHAAALETLRRLYRLLPAAWRVQVRRGLSAAMTLGGDRHARRMRQEIARFSGETEVNDLPPIYHYWSNRHLRPLIEAFGFAYPEDFFARTIADHAARIGRAPRIVSLGCGNGDTEVRVAKLLLARGVAAFGLRCLDITPAMLDRGRALAQAEGVDAHVRFEIADFNTWRAQAPADVVLANQCLHHVVALEHLFDAIASAIGDDGLFVTSDVIGRNGHQRWRRCRSSGRNCRTPTATTASSTATSPASATGTARSKGSRASARRTSCR